MTVLDVKDSEFDSYYKRYLDIVGDHGLLEGFELGGNNVIQFFEAIPEGKQEYRYAPDKWAVKEVLQHIIDTERVFIYRCFRIARNDKTALAGFDQDTYIQPSNATNKTLKALLDEYRAVRQGSISLLDSLSDENLSFIGVSSNTTMSSRAAAFIILGHEKWHLNIIEERYL